MKTLSKELFLMALLLMIVVFMVGMVFYEYMPNNKTVPEPITYTADSSTTAVLQEIATVTSQTTTGGSEVESVIKSYSIGTKELTTAASKQVYTSGKTDPFAVYKETVTNTVDGNTVTGSNSTASMIKQDLNTIGTFFESKTSK